MIEMSLMDMVLLTLGVLITMTLLSCLCCLCMKFSDLKMKCYLMELAKKKGMQVDLDTPVSAYRAHTNENCTIMVPESPESADFADNDTRIDNSGNNNL